MSLGVPPRFNLPAEWYRIDLELARDCDKSSSIYVYTLQVMVKIYANYILFCILICCWW